MNLYLFLVSVVFILIPISAARPMTSLFAEGLDASMLEIGLLAASYSVIPLLLAVMTGRLIDRFGERIPLMAGALGIVFSLSLPFLYPTLGVLYVSQLLLGGSQLFALVAIQNGVAGSASSEGRDRAIGTFSLFASVGMLLGPLIGGYAAENFGFQQTYIFLALFSIISLMTALFISPSKNKPKRSGNQKAGKMNELLKIPGLGRSIFVSMLNLAALDIFYVYFPLYASAMGLSPSKIGWILTIQASANALVRIFMPRLVERYGRVRILWIFMLTGALAY